jgi:hypothetical protein
VVRDLTIDCWYDDAVSVDQDHNFTRMAIELYGANNLVERVKAINFGAGKQQGAGECFVIAMALPTGAADLRMGRIQDCVITQPGNNGSVYYTGAPPEITCLSMSGASNELLGRGGGLLRNRIFDCPFDSSSQKSLLHGLTYGACMGTEVAGNQVVNFDGSAVYCDSWRDEDVWIHDNVFINVNKGVLLGLTTAFEPIHLRTRITDNLVVLGKKVSVSNGGDLCGVYLNIGSGITGITRLQDCWVQRNFIRGATVDGLIPVGVYWFINSTVFDNLVVEDNILEIPDAGRTPTFNVPYENALLFANAWAYSSAKVKVHSNRNLAGKDLRLKVVEYSTGKAYWRAYSGRVEHFQTVPLEGRWGMLYDEFVGQSPAFALGWAASTSGTGAAVSASAGEIGHPGVVKLDCGTTLNGYALLKLSDTSIILGAGGLSVILAMSVGRDGTNSVDNAESRFGLMQASGDIGIFFRVQFGTNDNRLYAHCQNASGSDDIDTNVQNWGGFTKLRIEVAADGSEARFFVDDLYVTKSTKVPTEALFVGLKIQRLAGTAAKWLKADYVQYQLV